MGKKKETIENERIVSPSLFNSEKEESLRPQYLKDYIGQEEMKKNLLVYIKSAKMRNTSLDHCLFYGPPGLGKTTIANIIANEMNSNIFTMAGPSINRPADIVSMLVELKDKDVLFIDEIHRVPKVAEEILYSAMEDFFIDITIGEGENAKTIHLPLGHFTLIGATTKAGMLSAPLRDRFGSINRLELYKPEELALILKNDAQKLNITSIDDAGLMQIATRSRGTPRIAIRLLKRLRDFALVENDGIINEEFASKVLTSLHIDQNGLDENDLRILNSIHNNFNDGPVGIETLAAFIGEDPGTIEDVCEPYLMQQGLLVKTPKGRALSEKGIKYLISSN